MIKVINVEGYFQSKVVLKMRLNPNIAVLLFVVSRFDFVFYTLE